MSIEPDDVPLGARVRTFEHGGAEIGLGVFLGNFFGVAHQPQSAIPNARILLDSGQEITDASCYWDICEEPFCEIDIQLNGRAPMFKEVRYGRLRRSGLCFRRHVTFVKFSRFIYPDEPILAAGFLVDNQVRYLIPEKLPLPLHKLQAEQIASMA